MESISFTMEKNLKSIHFLDVKLFKENNTISTTIYRKPTDRNNLLKFTSHHPPPLKKSLPISQFYRLKRICSNTDDYESQSNTMLNRFREKGYPEDCLDRAKGKVNNIERKDSFIKKQRNRNPNTINYVLTFDPFSSVIKSTILKHWHILSSG